jgi:hypothetical protein
VAFPEVQRGLQFVRELRTWAQSHIERRKGNRAQPTQDAYIIDVVLFYNKTFGGYPGKSPNSPCARFVRPATAPVITGTGGKPKSIEKVIRSYLWLPSALVVNSFPVDSFVVDSFAVDSFAVDSLVSSVVDSDEFFRAQSTLRIILLAD